MIPPKVTHEGSKVRFDCAQCEYWVTGEIGDVLSPSAALAAMMSHNERKHRIGAPVENEAETKAVGDRVIIKTMRFAVWGLGAIAILFVTYIVATLYIGAHDNRRIDELQLRIEKLERR